MIYLAITAASAVTLVFVHCWLSALWKQRERHHLAICRVIEGCSDREIDRLVSIGIRLDRIDDKLPKPEKSTYIPY